MFGGKMVKKAKSRDLDHLMEQNDTELSFLSAYGGLSNDNEDPSSIYSAVKRFLKAGGIKFEEKKQRIDFEFGYARCVENGCKIHFKGRSLPLVKSDLMQNGFIDGKLPVRRGSCTVIIQSWEVEQRRFIERLVEHINK
tara:strand:- start:851 stop:1267 length:417 start_codon:yes stop_codon:yes gene_type:complete